METDLHAKTGSDTASHAREISVDTTLASRHCQQIANQGGPNLHSILSVVQLSARI